MVVSIVEHFIQLSLACLIVVLNVLLIITLVKRRSLQTPSNSVLGCLCSSDLLIGVVILPLSGLDISITFGQHSAERLTLFINFAKALYGLTGLSSLFMILVNLTDTLPFAIHINTSNTPHPSAM